MDDSQKFNCLPGFRRSSAATRDSFFNSQSNSDRTAPHLVTNLHEVLTSCCNDYRAALFMFASNILHVERLRFWKMLRPLHVTFECCDHLPSKAFHMSSAWTVPVASMFPVTASYAERLTLAFHRGSTFASPKSPVHRFFGNGREQFTGSCHAPLVVTPTATAS